MEKYWTGVLYKGLVADFDESTVDLHSPCFLATLKEEALFYAKNLPAEGTSRRRVATYDCARPLKLFVLNENRAEALKELRALGVNIGSLAQMTRDIQDKDFDGLAVWGGARSGWHVVIAKPDIIFHVETQSVELDLDCSLQISPSDFKA